MAGRIWSALVAIGLAFAVGVLVTSTGPAAETGPGAGASPAELTASPAPAEAETVPEITQIGARADWVKPVATFRLLAVAAIAAGLGLVGAFAVRRRPDTRQPVPTRDRRHIIVSRGPPAFVA